MKTKVAYKTTKLPNGDFLVTASSEGKVIATAIHPDKKEAKDRVQTKVGLLKFKLTNRFRK